MEGREEEKGMRRRGWWRKLWEAGSGGEQLNEVEDGVCVERSGGQRALTS